MQKLGVPLQVVEAILGHTGSRAGIVGVYQRHDFLDEKGPRSRPGERTLRACYEDAPSAAARRCSSCRRAARAQPWPPGSDGAAPGAARSHVHAIYWQRQDARPPRAIRSSDAERAIERRAALPNGEPRRRRGSQAHYARWPRIVLGKAAGTSGVERLAREYGRTPRRRRSYVTELINERNRDGLITATSSAAPTQASCVLHTKGART